MNYRLSWFLLHVFLYTLNKFMVTVTYYMFQIVVFFLYF